MPRERGVTLRTYLAVQVMDATGCSVAVALEAVSSTFIEHPETDLSEKRTWQDWTAHFAALEKERKRG